MTKHWIIISTFSVIILLFSGCGNPISFEEVAGDEQDFDTQPPIVPCENDPECDNVDDPNLKRNSEVFFQTPSDRRVDILVVVDNSGSMVQEQTNMGSRFNSFISGLNDVDWQIGITTTDVSTGPYGIKGSLLPLVGLAGQKILHKNQTNADYIFKNTIQRSETQNCMDGYGDCPSGNEQGLYASILAMEKRNADNSGFFRNGSDLAIVVLSDEDEMSNAPAAATRAQNVIDKARSIWGTEKKVSAYGVIVVPGDFSCLNQQRLQWGGTGHYGTRVFDLAQLTGGVVGSVCDADYSGTLEAISQNVRDLIDSIELLHPPIPESVKVTFQPNQNINWIVQGNKILFDVPPIENTRIDVEYLYEAE
jgi:hypothetical protein